MLVFALVLLRAWGSLGCGARAKLSLQGFQKRGPGSPNGFRYCCWLEGALQAATLRKSSKFFLILSRPPCTQSHAAPLYYIPRPIKISQSSLPFSTYLTIAPPAHSLTAAALAFLCQALLPHAHRTPA